MRPDGGDNGEDVDEFDLDWADRDASSAENGRRARWRPRDGDDRTGGYGRRRARHRLRHGHHQDHHAHRRCRSLPGCGPIVAADNVTVNLNGHRVTGDPSARGAGPDQAGVVLRQVHGVTLTNGTVRDFDAGVLIGGGGRNTITRVRAVDNVNYRVVTGRNACLAAPVARCPVIWVTASPCSARMRTGSRRTPSWATGPTRL
ncbi:MAG: hypothetical protein M3256_21750 [Actinomycetota bacterium]|nr:hypothetical protein [Actinomycetota bacterium]